eukprot:COSAG06_NODE_45301_length_356_cov_0.579767_1_plen_26_part_01
MTLYPPVGKTRSNCTVIIDLASDYFA